LVADIPDVLDQKLSRLQDLKVDGRQNLSQFRRYFGW